MNRLTNRPGRSLGSSVSARNVGGESKRTRAIGAVGLVFIGAVLAAGLLTWSGSDAYRFLFGDLNPLLITGFVASIGAISLRQLVRQEWFSLVAGGTRDFVLVVSLGAALAVPAIIIDLFGAFPRDLNVAFPEALLFYPSIALIAESAFHVIPLAVLATLWRLTSRQPTRAPLVALGIAALTEPVFQVILGSGHSPAWANIYVGIHLLLFSVIALAIFRRRGFLAMYLLRIGYYLIWHLAWGYMRIPLLFGGET